jgi:hypothetical protein
MLLLHRGRVRGKEAGEEGPSTKEGGARLRREVEGWGVRGEG